MQNLLCAFLPPRTHFPCVKLEAVDGKKTQTEGARRFALDLQGLEDPFSRLELLGLRGVWLRGSHIGSPDYGKKVSI